MSFSPKISFVIPLYNEEGNFDALISRLNPIMDQLNLPCEVVLVDDGSTDSTPVFMSNLALSDARYQAIFLSRNHGHQLALSAGFKMANASEAILVLDGDLQDSPEMIFKMLEKMKEGFDVVYGVRKNRKEAWIKKVAYHTFYRLMQLFAKIDLPLDSGDFALVNRKVVNYLNQMPEQNRYLRGMRAWVGFKQIGIPYEREGRYAGKTKYSFRKLLELAYSGIFNFSDLPIKFITRLGILTILISLFYLIYVLVSKFFYNNVPTGFTATFMAIVMFSGVQLISLGIIGEYVLRIFQQSQQRPLFIIDKIIKNQTLHHGQELLP